MAGLGFSDKIAENTKNLQSMEHMLGKGLMQPFNNTNAGSRKIMFSVHKEHVFPLMSAEKAIIETGYEIRYSKNKRIIHSASEVRTSPPAEDELLPFEENSQQDSSNATGNSSGLSFY